MILFMLALPPVLVALLPSLPLSVIGLYLILWGTLLPVLLFGGTVSLESGDWKRGADLLAGILPLIMGLVFGALAGVIGGWLDPEPVYVPSIFAHLMLGVLWAAAVYLLVRQRIIELRPHR